MISLTLGLATAVCLGIADFIGGTRTRSIGVIRVALTAQVAGLVMLLPVLVVAQAPLPQPRSVAIAVVAGMAASVGLVSLYKGLAIGPMGIVAPISGTGAVIPVAVGIAGGESLSSGQGAGCALAIAGVMLASRGSTDAAPEGGGRTLTPGLGYALVAAAAAGVFIAAIGKVGADDVIWAAVVGRITAALLLAAAALLTRSEAPRVFFVRDRAVISIGFFDGAAWVLLGVAAAHGLLSIVGVLVCLYPVVTVALARAVHDERLRTPQLIGVACVMAGVVLLAAT